MKIGSPLCRRSALSIFAGAQLACAALLPVSGANSGMPTPVKLAIFEFELEDFSADAPLTKGSPADAAQLQLVTAEVRRLIAASGRYSLVDTSGAHAQAVEAHELRNCDGCDAGIALKLGADQSLIGVVTRISRVEYNVAFQIRDARTGAVITNRQSGLRMGADYSWSRGAASLVKSSLLETRDQP
jgi:Protein of unknown function (DUF2380)